MRCGHWSEEHLRLPRTKAPRREGTLSPVNNLRRSGAQEALKEELQVG